MNSESKKWLSLSLSCLAFIIILVVNGGPLGFKNAFTIGAFIGGAIYFVMSFIPTKTDSHSVSKVPNDSSIPVVVGKLPVEEKTLVEEEFKTKKVFNHLFYGIKFSATIFFTVVISIIIMVVTVVALTTGKIPSNFSILKPLSTVTLWVSIGAFVPGYFLRSPRESKYTKKDRPKVYSILFLTSLVFVLLFSLFDYYLLSLDKTDFNMILIYEVVGIILGWVMWTLMYKPVHNATQN